MSKSEEVDGLTPEEVQDIEEYYRSNDLKKVSAEDFIKELQSA